MISLLLIAAAVAALFSDQLTAFVAAHRGKLPQPSMKHVAAGVCVAAGVFLWWREQPVDDGRPTPAPGAVGELDLTGLFTGQHAADDAASLAALCEELASAVEFDGEQSAPRLKTGWQIADLRASARDIKLRGETYGDRQPAVRDAVKRYLDRPEILGKGGGPLTARDRAQWIAAFRDIARAAEAAVQ